MRIPAYVSPVTSNLPGGMTVSYAEPKQPSPVELAAEALERARSQVGALEQERRGVELARVTDRHSPSGRLSDLTPSGLQEVIKAHEAARAGRLALIDAELGRARAAVEEATAAYRETVDADRRRQLDRLD